MRKKHGMRSYVLSVGALVVALAGLQSDAEHLAKFTADEIEKWKGPVAASGAVEYGPDACAAAGINPKCGDG